MQQVVSICRNAKLRLRPSLHNPPVQASPPRVQVVSLFDYRASRSDELSLRRGDVIQVLFKDNQTWWFGRLHGGLQGYFLSAYVVDQSEALPDSRRPPSRLLALTLGLSVPGDFRDRNTEALPAEETTARSTPTRVGRKWRVPPQIYAASFERPGCV